MPIKSFFARRAARKGIFQRKTKAQLTSRVVIRKPVSWQNRLLWGGLVAVVAAVAGAALFLGGQYSAGYDSFSTARSMTELKRENAELRARAAELTNALETASTQLHIEQGAHQSMEAQLLKLEDERNRLNRDLALFDNLFPSAENDGRPSIRGFRIEPASSAGNLGTWRYRLLIMRSGKVGGSFVGEFQLQVRYRQGGQDRVAQTADAGKISEALEFQRYQRVEGQFQAPPGAKLLGAVARVMDNGKLVAESIYRP
ncbi:hypothetical protein EZJ19_13760 [Parasulfuritortus cantonensis]|uniref:Uncharacterized protein n=1 Tax=Parasulfuritortus cantonensis TaxID=2528202 RepID=A0A4R1B232_9PROT|nr:DUF6776 family protein [Parasulfuritortus cantonensis]TCJ11871.1 hypothetical protein EZJ19_13760 [Parasulfuritortus cantonensis]